MSLQPLASPTNLVWILGRTQTNGPDDYAAVHAVQKGYKLVPLSAFGRAFTPPKGPTDPTFDGKTPPVEKLKAMSAATYFDTLARLMKANPPPVPVDVLVVVVVAPLRRRGPVQSNSSSVSTNTRKRRPKSGGRSARAKPPRISFHPSRSCFRK